MAESDPEDWWRAWNINIRGTYLVTRAFLPLLLKGGPNKQIVNLTSIGGHVTTPGASAYQISKLALMRFTEAISAEYGDEGILAYTVHPGGVATEMGLSMPEYLHHCM